MLLSPRDKQVAVLCEEIFKLPAIFQCLKLIEKQIWFDVFTERMGSTMVMINIALVVCCPSKPIQDLEKNISYLLRPEFKRIFLNLSWTWKTEKSLSCLFRYMRYLDQKDEITGPFPSFSCAAVANSGNEWFNSHSIWHLVTFIYRDTC